MPPPADPTGPDKAAGATSLTLAQAADRLGVHYMTVHRYVRLGRLPGRKVGGAWQIDPADVDNLKASTPAASARSAISAEDVERLTSALVAGDQDAAWGLVAPLLMADGDASVLHVDLLRPALVAIGDRWAAGTLSVAEEHRASATARRLIGRAGPEFTSPGRRRGTVIVGAAPEDRHGLATAMFSDLVRANGVEVIDLGPAAPAASFVETVRQLEGHTCVCLTVTCDDALPSAEQALAAVASTFPATPRMVGGHAVTSEHHARSIGATAWQEDAVEAARLAATLAANRKV